MIHLDIHILPYPARVRNGGVLQFLLRSFVQFGNFQVTENPSRVASSVEP